MFSLFKRKNYTVCGKVKAAILVEIPVGCWMGLLGTAEHGPPFPKCINICFFKAVKVTLDLKYPKDITGTFFFFPFYVFFWGVGCWHNLMTQS